MLPKKITGGGRVVMRVNNTHLLVHYPHGKEFQAELPTADVYNKRAKNIAHLLRYTFGTPLSCATNSDNGHTTIDVACSHPAWGSGSVPFVFESLEDPTAQALLAG